MVRWLLLAGVTVGAVAGGSESAAGQECRSAHLIAIDLRTGKYEPWFPKVGYYAYVFSMTVAGDRVLAAGSFCPGP